MATVTPSDVVTGLDLLAVTLQSIEAIATAAQAQGTAGGTTVAANLVPELFTVVGQVLTGGAQATANELSAGGAALASIFMTFGSLLTIHAAAQPAATPVSSAPNPAPAA